MSINCLKLGVESEFGFKVGNQVGSWFCRMKFREEIRVQIENGAGSRLREIRLLSDDKP